MSRAPETRAEAAIPEHLTREEVQRVARDFTRVYHDLKSQTFGTTTWLRVPLVKTAADMLAFQQIIAETRPELIVETGVYVGGSALMFASMQELLGIDGQVIAVDVDLSLVNDRVREHTRIELIEGSSTDPKIVSRIRAAARGKRTMVDLDADHRAHHVLEELRTYSPLVSPGCYLVVEDTFLGGRPIRPEAVPGPSEALDAWLGEDPPFEIDRWRERYLLTQNPRGYLRRIDEDGSGRRRREPPDDYAVGMLELTPGGPDTRAQPPPHPDHALDELEAAAGEPDHEVQALRRTIGNLARGERQARIEADLESRRQEVTVENLLSEIETQRELLEERNRLLAEERARLRYITDSRAYRMWQAMRRLPLVRRRLSQQEHVRRQRSQARAAQRARTRRERSQRFIDHHGGQ